MRPSLLLLPTLVVALPIAQSKWPSGSFSLSSIKEKAGTTEGGNGLSAWLEKLKGGKIRATRLFYSLPSLTTTCVGKSASSSNFHTGSDGTWDVLEPTAKVTPEAVKSAKAKPAQAKPAKPAPPAPAEKKVAPAGEEATTTGEEAAPPEGVAVAEVEAVEEEQAPVAPAPQPKPAKVAPKEAPKSEFIGTGFNPDEPKKSRGWFGLGR